MAAGSPNPSKLDEKKLTANCVGNMCPSNEFVAQNKSFSGLGAVFIIISLVTYLIDTLTDFMVATHYMEARDYTWGILTLAFIFVPCVIVQIFSARWYAADDHMRGCHSWVVHGLLLQPLERYLYALVAALTARRTQDPAIVDSYYYQQNDVCMLRLFEAFLESAPQLVLQLYIMVATNDANWLTGVSACISLFAIGWAVAAYNHALRQAYREDYRVSVPGLTLQTFWHVFMVAARVCALVAFASVLQAWIFLVLGLHWVAMTTWVLLQKTDFCPSYWEERLFNGVVGVVYCFSFFSLKEGSTRWRMSLFYGIMFLENSILVAVGFSLRKDSSMWNQALIITVFLGFVLGLMCLCVYYRWFHPSGPIYCCQSVVQKLEKQCPDESPSPHTSPAFTKAPPAPRVSTAQLKVALAPQITSASLLPRRTLLKTQVSKETIVYKEVCLPSELSPVSEAEQSPCVSPRDNWSRPPPSASTTFRWDENGGFHHYSVDASDCFQSSRCATLDFTGVELSKGTTGNPTDPLPASGQCAPLTPTNQERAQISPVDLYSPVDYDVPYIDVTLDESQISYTPESRLAGDIPQPSPVKIHRPQQYSMIPVQEEGQNSVVAPGSTTDPDSQQSITQSCSSGDMDSQYYEFGSNSGSEISQPTHPQREYMSTPRLALKLAPVLQTLVTPIRPVKNMSIDEGLCGEDYDDEFNYSADEHTVSLNHSQYDNLTTDTKEFDGYY